MADLKKRSKCFENIVEIIKEALDEISDPKTLFWNSENYLERIRKELNKVIRIENRDLESELKEMKEEMEANSNGNN